jgi:hypothetical protein
MENTLSLIWTGLSIIALILSGAVWVMFLVYRVSTRITTVALDVKILQENVKTLNVTTSYEHLEQITKRAMLQVIHDEDFKRTFKSILNHHENNYKVVLQEILDRLDHLDKKHHVR